MKIEYCWNTLDGSEWWFDLGISYQKTPYSENKRVITLAFIAFSIYFRW